MKEGVLSLLSGKAGHRELGKQRGWVGVSCKLFFFSKLVRELGGSDY